jgi:hypothetical protein
VAQVARLDGLIGEGRNVFFAHTMAGGIPKAKVFLAIANRIYKGKGERFMSSQTLLDSDLGKLILQNFDEVSANSFQYLIEGSAIRARIEAAGGQVRYSAYGYHGTEILRAAATSGRPTPATPRATPRCASSASPGTPGPRASRPRCTTARRSAPTPPTSSPASSCR